MSLTGFAQSSLAGFSGRTAILRKIEKNLLNGTTRNRQVIAGRTTAEDLNPGDRIPRQSAVRAIPRRFWTRSDEQRLTAVGATVKSMTQIYSGRALMRRLVQGLAFLASAAATFSWALAEDQEMTAAPVMAISQATGMMPAQLPGPGYVAVPARYDQPSLPGYAWPTYAAHPNYAAVTIQAVLAVGVALHWPVLPLSASPVGMAESNAEMG